MTALSRPDASRRLALAAATVLIIAGSQLGMLWLANAYLAAERGAEVLSIEALCGTAAILVTLPYARVLLPPELPRVLTQDRVGRWLFAFLTVCIIGELLRPNRTLEHVTTFVSFGAYYLIGVAVGRWFATERAAIPILPAILTTYSAWYLVLAGFYLTGDLGFYGILPTTDVARLEFRGGFTATELPIYAGFQLPVLVYALLTPRKPMLRWWALGLLGCATGLIYLSASSAALAALLMVSGVSLLAKRGASLASLARTAGMVAMTALLLLAASSGIIESTVVKLMDFLSSEGVRALIYAELVNIIATQPMGIGKSRFVESNQFSWLGEGVFPHNNVLGIGAEMGVLAMVLFLMVCLAALTSLGRIALGRHRTAPQRVRMVVAVALGVFIYQQFRGLFQDTWVFKETYFWLGVGMGVALSWARASKLPMLARGAH
ncbi:MAG: O-antigen ligase family protein [Ralstonia sp.]|nr:MAG: O-antigen ligase family protein [Ralstonia sp.]